MAARQRGVGGRGASAPRARAAGLILAAAALSAAPVYAMHISDGVLPVAHAGLWAALCVPFLYLAVRDLNRRKRENLTYVPLVAMVGAAVFILSVFHIPVAVSGSSSHPTGGALAAILIGPLPAALVSCIALLLQALFLGHGGITSWGANTFSMGIAGVFVGYGVFRLLGRTSLPLFARAGLAAFLSNLLGTYGTAALQLALGLHGDAGVGQAWAAFMLGYIPTQAPLAVLDFLIAGYMCEFVARRRPDIARHVGLLEPESRLGTPAAPAGWQAAP